MSKPHTRAQTAEDVAQTAEEESVQDLLLKEIQELKKKLEKLNEDNENQNLVIQAKESEIQKINQVRENELVQLGEVKAVSLISNPLLAIAKKDSTGKKENIKNSPFEMGKMPLKFQVTKPLPGSFDESDVRKIPYQMYNGYSIENRLTFAANVASYIRAGGTKTLMQAGDYQAVEEIFREYSEYGIDESISNADLVSIIYE